MTDDDKALVERLRDFVIAEDIDLAADRIEALSAEKEAARMEERAAIVAWCRNVNMDWCGCAEAIEAGEHLK